MELRLARLPDRTPVKITIIVNPELHRMLQEYAALYAKAYGSDETVAELCPYMLQTFLEGDRVFQKARKAGDGASTQTGNERED
jgi:hypothetical protein